MFKLYTMSPRFTREEGGTHIMYFYPMLKVCTLINNVCTYELEILLPQSLSSPSNPCLFRLTIITPISTQVISSAITWAKSAFLGAWGIVGRTEHIWNFQLSGQIYNSPDRFPTVRTDFKLFRQILNCSDTFWIHTLRKKESVFTSVLNLIYLRKDDVASVYCTAILHQISFFNFNFSSNFMENSIALSLKLQAWCTNSNFEQLTWSRHIELLQYHVVIIHHLKLSPFSENRPRGVGESSYKSSLSLQIWYLLQMVVQLNHRTDTIFGVSPSQMYQANICHYKEYWWA